MLEGEESVAKLWKQVALVEDFYNIIQEHHVGHCDAETTNKKLSLVYHGVPLEAVELFVATCPFCLSNNNNNKISTINDCNKKKEEVRQFMRKGQIELLQIEHNFLFSNHIGLYVDTWSNYHILFPVNSTSKDPAHWSVLLIRRVYSYYGVPSILTSTMGAEFIDGVIASCITAWPDASVISNGCRKPKNHTNARKRAEKSQSLISRLLDGCGKEFENIELSLSATEDFLLSIQYKMNVLVNKKTSKCPYELVYDQLPTPGPHTRQLLSHRELSMHNIESDYSDGEEERRRERPDIDDDDISPFSIACPKFSDTASDQVMINRLAQKVSTTSTTNSNNNGGTSGGNNSRSSQQQQIQKMLTAGTIHAQEQQVTSLRELLKQEEKRLEVLRQMRSVPLTPGSTTTKKMVPSTGTVRVTGVDSSHGGVIRTTHGILTTTQEANSSPISTRLQQLVDSVAVNQMSSQASQIKNSLHQPKTAKGGSAVQKIQPKVSSMTIPQNGIQKVVAELDEATILRTIENSSRYREFLLKQSNLRRNFQKQIDKKIGSASYPKTFRQVWPIIPVQDNNFVKNIGLETVTLYFDPSYRKPPAQPSKVKPTCNQCGCDFASAWQIRKNNSKQVLLCESCDFTNLKLFQRSKLSTQLNELMESVVKEEQKLKEELEDTKKQTMAVERAALVGPKQQKPVVKYATADPRNVNHLKRPGMSNGGSPHIATSVANNRKDDLSRKRKSMEEHSVSKVAKTSPNLDQTLNKISQQLIRKQVDEKVGKRHSQSPTPRVISSKTRGPPPLKQVSTVSKTTLTQPTVTMEPMIMSTPPPLINNSLFGSDSRKSRRKGTPRHKLMGND